MKTTAIAPSNIAFIKYWGRSNEKYRLPANGSISMNLSNLYTTTTVMFDKSLKEDNVTINNLKNHSEIERVSEHLDKLRQIANISRKAKVVSQNSFPKSSGLSSSASGFAALTVAAAFALGLKLSEKELSLLARQGSGSACRSIPDGFVEWKPGENNSSYAYSLFPNTYWSLCDVVVIVSYKAKAIPTRSAQTSANTSPFFKTRLEYIEKKIEQCKRYIREKDFEKFGQLIEKEALEFHSILLTCEPSLLYWLPETVAVIHFVQKLRQEGLPVYFTINTGHDLHVICMQKDKETVVAKLKNLSCAKQIIENIPAKGAYITGNHLF